MISTALKLSLFTGSAENIYRFPDCLPHVTITMLVISWFASFGGLIKCGGNIQQNLIYKNNAIIDFEIKCELKLMELGYSSCVGIGPIISQLQRHHNVITYMRPSCRIVWVYVHILCSVIQWKVSQFMITEKTVWLTFHWITVYINNWCNFCLQRHPLQRWKCLQINACQCIRY